MRRVREGGGGNIPLLYFSSISTDIA